jgi:hypothetical protein
MNLEGSAGAEEAPGRGLEGYQDHWKLSMLKKLLKEALI